MKHIIELIAKLKSEGKNVAVLIIDEQNYSSSEYASEHLKTKYQRQVILKCSKLDIPSIFIYMDRVPINQSLYKAAPEGLRKQIYKPGLNSLSSLELLQELKEREISHVVIMGTRTDTCVKSTIFGMGPLSKDSAFYTGIQSKRDYLKAKGINPDDFIKGIEEGLVGLNFHIITAPELVRDSDSSMDMYSRIDWPVTEQVTIFETPRLRRFFKAKEITEEESKKELSSKLR